MFSTALSFSDTVKITTHSTVRQSDPFTGPVVTQRLGRGIALLFHDHGARRGWVASSTPRPHFIPGKDPVPIVQETGWAPVPVWTGGKSRPPPGFDPRTVQPVVSLYTDWATRHHAQYTFLIKAYDLLWSELPTFGLKFFALLWFSFRTEQSRRCASIIKINQWLYKEIIAINSLCEKKIRAL